MPYCFKKIYILPLLMVGIVYNINIMINQRINMIKLPQFSQGPTFIKCNECRGVLERQPRTTDKTWKEAQIHFVRTHVQACVR